MDTNTTLVNNITRYRSNMVRAASRVDPQGAEDATHDAIVDALQYYHDKYDPTKDKRGKWLLSLAAKTARQSHKPYKIVRHRVIECPSCGQMVKERSQCQCGLGIPVGLSSDADTINEQVVPDCYSEYEEHQNKEAHWDWQDSLLESIPAWLREAMFLVYVDRHKTAREVAVLFNVDYHSMMIQFRGAKRRIIRKAMLLEQIQ